MAGPGRTADLFLDQAVGGLGIGNAQQGLGQAHQGNALMARQPVFLEEALQPRLLFPPSPDGAHQAAGPGIDAGARLGRERSRLQEPTHRTALAHVRARADGIPSPSLADMAWVNDHLGIMAQTEPRDGRNYLRAPLLASKGGVGVREKMLRRKYRPRLVGYRRRPWSRTGWKQTSWKQMSWKQTSWRQMGAAYPNFARPRYRRSAHY